MPYTKSRKNTRRLLTAGLMLAVLLPATWVLGDGSTGGSTSMVSSATLSGLIATPEPVPVIAPESGAIVSVSVNEGDAVQVGDVLAVLAHDETKLVAPVAGIVTRRSVSRGSVVRPNGAAPFLITPQTPLRLLVEVVPATARSLRAASVATFSVPDDKGHTYKARFTEVRAETNAAGSLRYIASFTTEGSAAPVRAGMMVSVTLTR
jgi:multidrug efflux pump subunit AcrA (membrane-fusion protein)